MDGGRHPVTASIRRLDVLWRRPGHRRYPVGILSLEDDGTFAFEYSPVEELREAEAAGFQGIAGLPNARGASIRSPHLFATFAQRIPSPKRPDFLRLMSEWGVEDASDKFQILARSGGLLLTDHLELCEHRDRGDDLSTPLSFVVAGMRYGEDVEANLAHTGDRVLLRREPTNDKDADAVRVQCNDLVLGYVPRQYSPLVSALLDSGATLDAVIERRLLVPNEGPHWVVRAWNASLHRVA
jgi:hypothetical protein